MLDKLRGIFSRSSVIPSALVGTWKLIGDFNSQFKAENADWRESDAILKSMYYVVRRSGRYTWFLNIWSLTQRIEGRVETNGDIVTFTPETVNGVPVVEARGMLLEAACRRYDFARAARIVGRMVDLESFHVLSDGKLESMDPTDSAEGDFYLTRI